MLENRVTRFITSIVEAVVILFISAGVSMLFFEELSLYLGMLALMVGVVHIVNEFLYDVLNFDSINCSLAGRIFKRVIFCIVLVAVTFFEMLLIGEFDRLTYGADEWLARGVIYASVFGGTAMSGYFLLATTLHWDTDDTVFAQPIAIGAAYIAGFVVALLGQWIPFVTEYGPAVLLGLATLAMILYIIFISWPYSEDEVII